MLDQTEREPLAGDSLIIKPIGKGFSRHPDNKRQAPKRQWKPDELAQNAVRRAAQREGGRPDTAHVLKRARELFDIDPTTGVLSHKKTRGRAKAGSRAGSIMPNGYRVVCIDYWSYRASHIVWLLTTGEFPPAGKIMDHRDGNRANDAWANLRLATYAENAWNRKDKRRNKAGRRGVYKVGPERWEATLVRHGEVIHLGRYRDRNEAIKAREVAERELYGEFRRAA